MSLDHLDPARTVIQKIGTQQVAEITGKHVSRVYRWMYPKSRGGTGGLIPQADMPALLAYAIENHIELSPAEFFPAIAAVPLIANRPDKFDGLAAADLQPSDGFPGDRHDPDQCPLTVARFAAAEKRAAEVAELDPDGAADG